MNWFFFLHITEVKLLFQWPVLGSRHPEGSVLFRHRSIGFMEFSTGTLISILLAAKPWEVGEKVDRQILLKSLNGRSEINQGLIYSLIKPWKILNKDFRMIHIFYKFLNHMIKRLSNYRMCRLVRMFICDISLYVLGLHIFWNTIILGTHPKIRKKMGFHWISIASFKLLQTFPSSFRKLNLKFNSGLVPKFKVLTIS